MRQWEDAVKSGSAKVIGDVGSFLINDKTRRYDGQDFEKVMLFYQADAKSHHAGSYDLARSK